MECNHCGAQFRGHPARCPECDTRLKPKRPPLLIRALLSLVSVAVYLVLIVSVLTAAVLTDIHLLTSSGGIQDILDYVLTTDRSPTVDPTINPSTQVGKLNLLTSTDYGDYTIDEDGNIIDKDGNIIGNIYDTQDPEGSLPEFSMDMLTSTESLSNYLAEIAQEMLGDSTTVTAEQIQTFIEQSTLTEFVADKTASLLEDVLTGSANTTITAEDLIGLVEENEALIEEVFQVELTEEIKQEISVSVHEAIGEEDLAQQVRTEVAQSLDAPIEELGGMTANELMATIKQLSQPSVVVSSYALCLTLMVLLCLLSYYNIPKGLRWSASACLTVGLLLSIPTFVLQHFPTALAQQIPELTELMSVFSGVANVMAPVHYTLTIAGFVMYVLGIVWRFFKRK